MQIQQDSNFKDNNLEDNSWITSSILQTKKKVLILGVDISLVKNHGVLRFESFCRKYDLEYGMIGQGIEWKGGNLSNSSGGGQKILELRKTLKQMTENRLIFYGDSYDQIPLASDDEIYDKYMKITEGSDMIVFSTDYYCWPDFSLKSKFPKVATKYKYLCSGAIMGYRDTIYNLICETDIKNDEDDQEYFSRKFIEKRDNLMLDYNCELFQAAHDVEQDLILHRNRVYNHYTKSYPSFMHGNGDSKKLLNRLENYLETDLYKNYTFTPLTNNEVSDDLVAHTGFPQIFIAIYVDNVYNSKNFKTFYTGFEKIKYKNTIVAIYDCKKNHIMEKFAIKHGYIYRSDASSYYYQDFIDSKCEYYFLLEQTCVITNPGIINELLYHSNNTHQIISPVMKSHSNDSFANCWGDIEANGYYKRSDDYFDIIHQKKIGHWNVPYISGCIFMKRNIITDWDLLTKNKHTGEDREMELAFNFRKNTLFMYAINFSIYGYLNL